MKTNNTTITKGREYKKPTLSELRINKTKGGRTASRNENKVHWNRNNPPS